MDRLAILVGSAHPALGHAVARACAVSPADCLVQRFPDGECHIELQESVRGDDVFVLQPTAPPVDEHLVELLLLADAARRAGAAQVTAVVPYFGYARQDRRVGARTPVAARVVGDLLSAAGFARVVAVDAHTPALEGFFSVPFEHLSAEPLLAAHLEVPEGSVVVAPDLGAVKLAQRYAARLRCPLALLLKLRRSGSEVAVRQVVGEVAGRHAILVDDMISTAGTMEAAGKALLASGARSLAVAATHGLFVGPARERLARLPLTQLVTTDTVPAPASAPPSHQRVSVAELLGEAILALRARHSLAGLETWTAAPLH